jgi:ribonuclease Z
MNFEVIFLGTSAAVPSPSRGHASIALKYFNEVILFDCGEGTQRQLIRSGTSYMKINKIFISLTVYGPRGIEDVLDGIISICRSEISFDIIPKEILSGPTYECDMFKIDGVKVDHSALTYGLVFEEVKGREFIREKALALGLLPGPNFSRLQHGEEVTVNGKKVMPDDVLGEKKACKKLVYTSDTRPCQKIVDVSKDAILIHDSTYDDTLRDQAVDATHSTCVEAAEIAFRAGAKKLFLTHISPRYGDTTLLFSQAKEVFKDTVVAKDFLKVKP